MKYFGISKRVKKVAECTPRDFDRGILFKDKKETKFKMKITLVYDFENFVNFMSIVNNNDILIMETSLDIYKDYTVIVTAKQFDEIRKTVNFKAIKIIEELK